MTIRRFSIIGVIIVLVALLAGCGPSAKDREIAWLKAVDAAKGRAVLSYQDFLEATSGDVAVNFRQQMEKDLAIVNLTTDAIGVAPGFLTQRVQGLYSKDEAAAFKKLKATHRNEKQAKDLAAECRRCNEKAGKSVSPSMEKSLALNVARNQKEEAVATERAHGVRPPVKKRPATRRTLTRR
jgi:hypothetical protein